ncbi:MAG TPA: DUF6807 family protein [Tepidisphaeraceae bacterium]|jgi:hypothetical protein|nr:DUF6807 family protein [Tepidisphaeraceae bacterium]
MRTFAITAATLSFACSMAFAQSSAIRLSVDPGQTERHDTPMNLTLPGLHIPVTRFLASLKSTDGETIQAQADQLLDSFGNNLGTRLEWVQPHLDPGHPRTYTLAINSTPYDISQYFHYIDADGYRDLFYGKQPVYRYVNKFDPADFFNTSKPFHHIYGFHDEGFITKGPPGGLYPHHRGIFLGFTTQFGNFWACTDVHQQHVDYVYGLESSGPVAARTISLVDWIDKDNRAVIRDTRDVTTYYVAKDAIVLDFDITMQSLAGDIKLTGNAQHAGFHFRAAQEVADAKSPGAKITAGGATYMLPPTAKPGQADEYLDCPWVACNFTIQGHPYTVLHMNAPSNPTPTSYSTRPYGRFGAWFNGMLKQDEPLHFKYRITILDASTHPNLSQEQLAGDYADFADPPKITIVK